MDLHKICALVSVFIQNLNLMAEIGKTHNIDDVLNITYPNWLI